MMALSLAGLGDHSLSGLRMWYNRLEAEGGPKEELPSAHTQKFPAHTHEKPPRQPS